MIRNLPELAPEVVQAVRPPVLLVIGDSDTIRPEHAVQMFRLLGGGVPGDVTEMPRSRPAILPGTSHIGMVQRAKLLLSMVPAFLDAPDPKAG
jgi:hypothetical protein